MVIKKLDDKKRVFSTLESLLKTTPPPQSTHIRNDLFSLKKGYQNEKETAYIIDFEFGEKRYTDVLHDLRLVHENQVAQIDHLLITLGGIYVLESKYFGQKVKIERDGTWSIFTKNGEQLGIKSPIEQNRRHIQVLKKILLFHELIPKRLGQRLNLEFHNLVLLSTNSVIEGEVPENVIKYDQIATKINRDRDENQAKYFGLNSIKILVTMITRNEMRAISKTLLRLHQPLQIDYAKKYNIPQEEAYDKTLYEALRIMRNNIIKTQHIPKQYILSNTTLKELARKKPKNPTDIETIEGMSREIYKRYGYRLLNLIIKYNK